MQKTILQRIQDAEALSEAEMKVAHYYEKGYPLSLSHSITHVSERCGVSVATVSRFIHRLGYESFYTLKAEADIALKDRLTSPIERYSSHRQKGAPLDGVNAYLEASIANLSETNRRIDTEQFQQAIEILLSCKRLFVMGAASAFTLANYFSIFTRYIRPNVILLSPDISTLPHHLADIDKNDALLAISHYRFSSVTTKVARLFHERGNNVVLITDRGASQITAFSTVTLTVASGEMPMFNSRVATLAMLEALFNAMIPYCEDEMESRFAMMEKMFEDFDVYFK